MELTQNMERKFSKVHISRSKVSVAKIALKKVTVTVKESKVTHDKIIGLHLEDFPILAERMIQRFTFHTESEKRI